ncbi:hypothetical protein OAT16_08030 [Prolixibacteraceae bacterium]|nr:hypothetical protein [Prolixibacteraceae bacterium]
MNIRSLYLLSLLTLTLCLSCGTNSRDVATEGAKTVENIVHIQKMITPQNATPEAIDLFVHNDPKGSLFFAQQVLRVGAVKSPEFTSLCQQFLSDSVVMKAYNVVDSLFQDGYDDKISDAFLYFNHYFPNKPLPEIYTLVSGFNENLLYNPIQIGVSLEKYLGENSKYYTMLGIPKYKQAMMKPSRIPLDVVDVWLRMQYPLSIKKRKLIDHIIYEGKILYVLSYLFPKQEINYPIGYTTQQWEWCLNSEVGMWHYLVDQKLLFKSDPLLIRKMIGPSPFTNFFTTKSPGQCGRWIGYKIIQSYMQNHRDKTLEELMWQTNASKVLNASNYAPK